MEQIIHKTLEKDPKVRYQSAKELLVDLNRVLRDTSSGVVTSWASETHSPPKEPSIAVLPFVNMSSDPDSEYFGEGLAEELINAMTHVGGVRVASRTSAFQFKGKAHDISVIGEALRVDTVLEGSVRKAGNRLRITAQLINVADGYHLWSERYDREMKDIFELQDDITRQIVDKLRIQLAMGSRKLLVKHSTENVEAYNLYLKGRYHLNRRVPEIMLKAVECFEQAATEDTHYALPHAGLAEAYILLNTDGHHGHRDAWDRSLFFKAKAAAHKATELDDSSAEAHAALALVYFRLDWNWQKAEQEFCIALKQQEGLASVHHQYAMFLAMINLLDEALVQIRRAHELDPLSPIISTAVGRVLHFARRFDEAIDQCRRTLDLNAQFPGAYFDLGCAYIEKGMYLEAISAMKKLGELSGDKKIQLLMLGLTYGRMGERQKAFQHLEKLSQYSQTGEVLSYPIAIIHMSLGDFDRAFELLDRAYQQRDSSLVYLQCDPSWDPLRSDPRFHGLLRRMNLEP